MTLERIILPGALGCLTDTPTSGPLLCVCVFPVLSGMVYLTDSSCRDSICHPSRGNVGSVPVFIREIPEQVEAVGLDRWARWEMTDLVTVGLDERSSCSHVSWALLVSCLSYPSLQIGRAHV